MMIETNAFMLHSIGVLVILSLMNLQLFLMNKQLRNLHKLFQMRFLADEMMFKVLKESDGDRLSGSE